MVSELLRLCLQFAFFTAPLRMSKRKRLDRQDNARTALVGAVLSLPSPHSQRIAASGLQPVYKHRARRRNLKSSLIGASDDTKYITNCPGSTGNNSVLRDHVMAGPFNPSAQPSQEYCNHQRDSGAVHAVDDDSDAASFYICDEGRDLSELDLSHGAPFDGVLVDASALQRSPSI